MRLQESGSLRSPMTARRHLPTALAALLLAACADAPTPFAKGCSCIPQPTPECNGPCYGERIFDSFCVPCHGPGTREMGPWLGGRFGERSPLIDGRSVLFDDAYFTRSILDADAELTTGWPRKRVGMPSFGLGAQEIEGLAEYVRTLDAHEPGEAAQNTPD
ncbi:MAG: hypothetical protein CMN30_05405 [Sandaracinus sp.]|nr:hypothetical protein [Sandaracinus sp.]